MILTHSGNADLASRRDETAPSNPQSADSSSTKKTASRNKSPVTPIGVPAVEMSKPEIMTIGSQKQTKSANKAGPSKTDLVLKKLRTTKGITLAQLVDLSGWQQHSVRGFLSGTVRKKLGLNLVSEVGKDGTRRYRVIDGVASLLP